MIPATSDSSFSRRAFLFLLALATTSSNVEEANGYSVAVPVTHPSNLENILACSTRKRDPVREINTLSLQEEVEVAALVGDNQRSSSSNRSTYDLGIGKNRPVHLTQQNDSAFTASHNTATKSHGRSVFEVTQFWNDHQAVRKYPAPDPSTVASDTSTKPKNILPVVNPTRQARDMLTIVKESPGVSSHQPKLQQPRSQPIMVPSSQQRKSQLDVNTVWVEMLIHSEQLKQQQHQERQVLEAVLAN